MTVTNNSAKTKESHTPVIFHRQLNTKTIGTMTIQPRKTESKKASLAFSVAVKNIVKVILIPAKNNL